MLFHGIGGTLIVVAKSIASWSKCHLAGSSVVAESSKVQWKVLPVRRWDTKTPDGRWWQSLQVSEKVAAIIGMYGGFKQGWYQGASQALDVAHQAPSFLNATNARYPETTKVTFGTISDRIDATYRDHPDLLDMPVYILFPCAAEEDGCSSVIRANENMLRQALKPIWVH
jgi:hypothetical protein